VKVLNMAPYTDRFLSGAADGTVRLWDLRSPRCQGCLQAGGLPIPLFDPQGSNFAVALDAKSIKIYSLAKFLSVST
jgi:COMPASS component SWD2